MNVSLPRSQNADRRFVRDTSDLRLRLEPSFTLTAGYRASVFLTALKAKLRTYSCIRSKDAAVNIWNLPLTFDISEHAPPPEPPKSLKKHFSKAEQGDLTALDWAFDGSLLAIGSYDAVLRICTSSGALYFANPQHQVTRHPIHSRFLTYIILMRRGRYLLCDFRKTLAGC